MEDSDIELSSERTSSSVSVSSSSMTLSSASASESACASSSVSQSQSRSRSQSIVTTCHSRAYHEFDATETLNIRSQLLQWYGANRRLLPWRGDPPPYTRSSTPTTTTTLSTTDSKQGLASAAPSGPTLSMSSTPDPAHTTNSSPASGSPASVRPSVSSDDLDPYAIWVSEIMLQQTRVETVIDYFQRWMTRFPTVQHLASASLEDVNHAWAGLGYYRRAKYLHEGAKRVVADFDGVLPTTTKELQKIPGIGPYTAGAIASSVFLQPVPCVDGNVIRVLSRLRGIAVDPAHRAGNQLIWKLAADLVPQPAVSEWNQAVMELGACVCTPKAPSCDQCPVRSQCHAHAEVTSSKRPHIKLQLETDSDSDSNQSCTVCVSDCELARRAPNSVTEYPLPKVRKPPREENVAVCVVRRQNSVTHQIEYLLVKRPPKGLLANQWELTSAVIESDKLADRQAAADALLLELGIDASQLSQRTELTTIIHVFSHIRHTMYVEQALFIGDEASHSNTATTTANNSNQEQKAAALKRETRWLTEEAMKSIGLTTGVKKIMKEVLQCHMQKGVSKRKAVHTKQKSARSNATKRRKKKTDTKSSQSRSTSSTSSILHFFSKKNTAS
jgi:A/G-specific adenine glycosylase